MTHSNYLIFCHTHYPEIAWGKTKNEFKLAAGEVHIWKIHVENHFHRLFKQYRNLLKNYELQRAKSFYWEKDLKKYIAGRIFLRILIGKYINEAPKKIQFKSEGGKPSLSSPVTLKYNISYCQNDILISIGLCETGIDIERINPTFDFNELSSHCFSKTEIESLSTSGENSREDFFILWTRKEALLKYTGQGLIDDLTIVPSLNGVHKRISKDIAIDNDTLLYSFRVGNECVGSLACPKSVNLIKYFEW